MNKQAVLFSLFAATFGIEAAPYTPASGNIVLERLPAKNDPAQRALAAARARLATDPRNPALAAAVARHYITLGREDADPRYLGYAQAVLSPWWSAPTPPAPVQLLRATILQSTHQFPAALRDLDQLVQAYPADAQAWLTRATVQQVTGDFAGARQSCTRLFGIAPDLVLRTCLAGVGSLTGTARASYQSLRQAYASHRSTDSGIADWVSTLLGEMAARLGDAPAAEQHFRQALALAPADAYLLGAYADFLLDQGRAAEAVPLLRGHEKADALLLRLGLALA
ncbi:MAG TPA: tetratricopeptide repeat protein, partial [Pseudoduganella sp.]